MTACFTRFRRALGSLRPGLAILLLAAAPCGAAAQQPVAGKARALDGITLSVAGRDLRLFGLSAPPAAAHCDAPTGQPWPCGWEAQMALANLTAYQWVLCEEVGQDSDGLPLAICHLGGRGGPELNLRLIGEGWASATAEAPQAYRDAVATARAERLGLWRYGIQAWPQTR